MKKEADKNGVKYSYGNRKARRAVVARKKIILQPVFLSKKMKLPKEFWKKGKSKFLAARLREEGKKCLAELYV